MANDKLTDYLDMFNTDPGNGAGAANFNVDFNLDLDDNLVARLSDSVLQLGLDSDSSVDENFIMASPHLWHARVIN